METVAVRRTKYSTVNFENVIVLLFVVEGRVGHYIYIYMIFLLYITGAFHYLISQILAINSFVYVDINGFFFYI